jgi:phage replication O-like protein O
MANPQKENGYTPIANEILEHLMKIKLNGTQFRIIMAVWRYTYGFSRKEYTLSESFLAKSIRTSRQSIGRELKFLFSQRILIVITPSSCISTAIIAFNKNYDEWEQVSNNTTGIESDKRGSIESDAGGSIESDAGGAGMKSDFFHDLKDFKDLKDLDLKDFKDLKTKNLKAKDLKKKRAQARHARAREGADAPGADAPGADAPIFENLSAQGIQSLRQTQKTKSLTESLFEGFSFSAEMRTRIEEWLAYKRERAETYKRTGLKSLLTQIERKLLEYPENLVIDLIEDCMACNYVGIVWEKIKRQGQGNNPPKQGSGTNGGNNISRNEPDFYIPPIVEL